MRDLVGEHKASMLDRICPPGIVPDHHHDPWIEEVARRDYVQRLDAPLQPAVEITLAPEGQFGGDPGRLARCPVRGMTPHDQVCGRAVTGRSERRVVTVDALEIWHVGGKTAACCCKRTGQHG